MKADKYDKNLNKFNELMKDTKKEGHSQDLESIGSKKHAHGDKQIRRSFTTDDIEERRATFSVEEFRKTLATLHKDQLERLLKRLLDARYHKTEVCMLPQATKAMDEVKTEKSLFDMPKEAFEYIYSCVRSAYEDTVSML